MFLISKNIPSGCSECLRSHLNNKTITVIVGKVPAVLHCFRLFTFKSIPHEVNNLVSASRSVSFRGIQFSILYKVISNSLLLF